jgi:hypothetical protein
MRSDSNEAAVLKHFSSTTIIVVLLLVSEHMRKLSSTAATVYKYVKEHYPVLK